MAPQPTVGLVGSRFIDEGLQSTNKKTVTEFAFPAGSRSADAIGKLPEGTASYTGPKNGDCYKDGVEDTNMCAGTGSSLSHVLAV